jgi:predicted anti-sigma-YlaC factor YlaD
MESCNEVIQRIGELAAVPVAEIPARVGEHLQGCPACTRALAAARLARGLLAAAAVAPEPPAEFADRVLAALPAPRLGRPDTDLWRLGWGLVPAFAAMAALLLILYLGSAVPGPAGVVPVEGLSSGERLVLEASPAEPDAILAAVMEGSET